MKPKTEQQKRVYSLSVTLPKLDQELESWAFETCIPHRGYRTKTAISCLSCGHIWKTDYDGAKVICPVCNRKLAIENSLKKKLTQLVYFGYLNVCEGFQVNRYFQMYVYHKAGSAPRVICREIIQQWMQPNGKHEVIARNRGGFGLNGDSFHGNLEIRDRNLMERKFDVYPYAIHPKSKWLPIYRRNGFKGNFGISSPYEIFSNILRDSKAETLLKAKQYSLLDTRLSSSYRKGSVDTFWNSVKICIRNKYVVKDATTWIDYLELLKYFNKDTNNHKYICPENLSHAHNTLVNKKKKIDQRIQAERDRIRREQDEKRKKRLEDNKVNPQSEDQLQYVDEKSQYFGLEFTQGDLKIKLLESVQEFFHESEALNHCVFTNEYFKKKGSLVFSAQIKGVRIETIEIEIDNLKIIQSRGLNNLPSKHNSRIINLMKRSLHLIERRSKLHQVAA